MKIISVGAALIPVERQTGIMMIRGSFCNYSNIPISGLRSCIMCNKSCVTRKIKSIIEVKYKAQWKLNYSNSNTNNKKLMETAGTNTAFAVSLLANCNLITRTFNTEIEQFANKLKAQFMYE